MSSEVRAEDHLALARVALRGLVRPDEEEDAIAAAALVLVRAANRWNAGGVTCAWTTYATNRIRWSWIRETFNRERPRRLPTVPLFETEDGDEWEGPELAREDPALCHTEARVDVERLLAGLPEQQARVLRLRYGIGRDEPATRGQAASEIGLPGDRVRQIEQKALRTLRHRAAGRRITP